MVKEVLSMGERGRVSREILVNAGNKMEEARGDCKGFCRGFCGFLTMDSVDSCGFFRGLKELSSARGK